MSLTAFDEDTYPVPLETNQETAVLSPQPQGVVALRTTLPNWIHEVLTKLENLATLQENWDSYGASPVNTRSITWAQELVCYLARFVGVDEPAVGATPDGEAGLSWDGGPWSLDVDVSSDGRMDYVYLDDRDARREVEASTHDPDDLLVLLTAWD